MAESTTSTTQSPPSLDALYEAATELQIFAFREESPEERKRLEHLCFRAGVELATAGLTSLPLLLDHDSLRVLPGGLLRGLCAVGEAKTLPASVVPGGPSNLDGVAARAESPFSTASLAGREVVPARGGEGDIGGNSTVSTATGRDREHGRRHADGQLTVGDEVTGGCEGGLDVAVAGDRDVDRNGLASKQRGELVALLDDAQSQTRDLVRQVHGRSPLSEVPSGYETDASVVAAAMEAAISVGNAAVALEQVVASAPPADPTPYRLLVAGLQATRLRLRSALQTAGLL